MSGHNRQNAQNEDASAVSAFSDIPPVMRVLLFGTLLVTFLSATANIPRGALHHRLESHYLWLPNMMPFPDRLPRQWSGLSLLHASLLHLQLLAPARAEHFLRARCQLLLDVSPLLGRHPGTEGAACI